MRHAVWMVSLLFMAGCTDAGEEEDDMEPMEETEESMAMAEVLYLHRSGGCEPGADVMRSMNHTNSADDDACPEIGTVTMEPLVFASSEPSMAHGLGAMVNGSILIEVPAPSVMSAQVVLRDNETVFAAQSVMSTLVADRLTIDLNMTLADNISEGALLHLEMRIQSAVPATIVMGGSEVSHIRIA